VKPGDRLVCAFIDSFEIGHQFRSWYLHVTVVPWFRLEQPSDKLATEFEQSLRGVASFKVLMDDETRFGRNKLVNLVAQPTPFMEVEKRVRSVLKPHGAWLVDETTKVARAYRPHVTEQASGRLHAGDSFECDRLYIVEQKGGYKEITAIIQLAQPS
jgi:hypothetical protein